MAICTDALNQRSRDAIDRLGAQFEGILRSHRLVNQPGETRPPRHRRLLDHQRRVVGRARRVGRPARTIRRITSAGRLPVNTGTIQLDVSTNSPSRLTGSPIHQLVDVAAPPRLKAAPRTAGAPSGTVPATIVVVVVGRRRVEVVLDERQRWTTSRARRSAPP